MRAGGKYRGKGVVPTGAWRKKKGLADRPAAVRRRWPEARTNGVDACHAPPQPAQTCSAPPARTPLPQAGAKLSTGQT